ncbi:beta strand repeat-containing protein, partial [Rhodanobacter glycinis]
MSKSTRINRRNPRTSARMHATPALVTPLPLRKTWPISLCVGLVVGSIVFSSDVLAGGPTGGVVVGGSGTITQSGNNTVINQASSRLALNWQTFNVGANESVLFNQPSRSAVALNRILDQNPSQIFGRINSNGQIFLINTHGIIFGATAQMNVGGLLASTLDLTPNDFLAGHYNLNAVAPAAGVVNHGLIQAASGGSVSLVGGSVLNDGLIFANYGKINLDGADHATLDFDGNGLINIQITGELKQRLDAKEAAVTNKGKLSAEDGTVVLQAAATKDLFTNLVNNSGVIDASGISTDGGVVRLVGNGGNVESSGSINVSGVHGGSAQLLSDANVGVTGRIDASGEQGGGTIRVGGGYQGGEGLTTANVTYLGPDAVLDADATGYGNGGSVVLWGNQGNNFLGSIAARGGVLGGNGGLVETSSHYGLNAQGSVDASSPRGRAGTWLIDPYNITIQTGAGTLSSPFSASADSTIKASDLNTALNGTNVTVFTGSSGASNGDITVNAAIKPSAGDNVLYLKAAGGIYVNADISAADASHKLDLYLWSNYGGTAAGASYVSNASCAALVSCVVTVGDTANAAIATNGGLVDVETGIGGGAFTLGVGSKTGSINTGTGVLTVHATGISEAAGANTITAGAATLDAGAGAIALGNAGNNFSGAVSLSNSGANDVVLNNGTHALNLAASTLGSGALTISATGISQSGAITQAASAAGATFNAGAGAISLGNSGNNFTGSVSLNNSGANAVTLNNGTHALDLATSALGSGALTVSAAGISQSGMITQAASAGAATFNAGTNAITLTDAGNAFTGAVSLAGSNVSLVNSTATILGTTTATGTLDVGSNGALSQSGALTVTGAATFTQNSTTAGATQDVNLGSQNNSFQGGVTFAAGAGAGINNLSLKNIFATPGTLTLPANVASILTLNYTNAALTVPLAGVVAGGLDLTAGSGITINGNVSTSGAQAYHSAVTLGADAILASSGNGNIGFDSTVDGAYALTVNTGGATSFGGAVGGATRLTSLTTDAGGSTMLGGNVTTSGAQTYSDALTLGGDATLASSGAGAINLGSTVDGAHALAVNTSGATTFGGAVGGTTALTSLTTDAGGGTTLNGNVSTTGAQTYNDAVTLSGSATLTSSGAGAISLNSAVDGAHSLTVNTTGVTTLVGAVGGTTALTSLTTDAGGSTMLGGNVTTSGAQTYNDAVALSSNATLASSGAGAINLGGTVNGAHALAVNTSGATTFGGAVGGTTALTSLTTDAGGGTTLNGNVSTTGAQTYNDAIALGTDVTLATANGAVSFGSTVDNATATKRALTVNAGTGAVTFTGALGNGANGALASLATNSGTFNANALNIGSGGLAVTTAAGGIAQGGAFTVAGTSSFNAGSGAITLTNSGNDFTGAVSLSNSGANDVAVSDANALVLGASTIGSGALTLTATGISQTGAIVQAAGGGAVTLDAGAGDLTLTNAGNDFTGPVTASGQAVRITDATALDMVGFTSALNKDVSLVAGGQLTLAPTITAIDTGSGNLTLSS